MGPGARSRRRPFGRSPPPRDGTAGPGSSDTPSPWNGLAASRPGSARSPILARASVNSRSLVRPALQLSRRSRETRVSSSPAHAPTPGSRETRRPACAAEQHIARSVFDASVVGVSDNAVTRRGFLPMGGFLGQVAQIRVQRNRVRFSVAKSLRPFLPQKLYPSASSALSRSTIASHVRSSRSLRK